MTANRAIWMSREMLPSLSRNISLITSSGGVTAVSDALYLAFTLGATLGYGTVDGSASPMVRARPTDVALAVRRIVGRR